MLDINTAAATPNQPGSPAVEIENGLLGKAFSYIKENMFVVLMCAVTYFLAIRNKKRGRR